MNNDYIEYLTELEYILRELEHSWLHAWVGKSVDKKEDLGISRKRNEKN